jgi:hypothetical protein
MGPKVVKDGERYGGRDGLVVVTFTIGFGAHSGEGDHAVRRMATT